MRDTPIAEFMSTDVSTVAPDQPIEDAISQLVASGHSGAPVVEDGKVVGLLDDTDIILSESRLHAPTVIEILGSYLTLPGQVKRFEDEVRHALGQTVGEVMRRDFRTLPPDATAEDAATCLIEGRQSRAPVVDADGTLVGIVTRGGLVRQLATG